MAHDVFISYSSKNKTTADAICHVLEENKIKCWIAPRDISVGEKYGDVIERAIVSCKVFIIVFSKESSLSSWVESELNIAFTDRRVIMPFRIDTTNLEGEMRLILNNKHWIDAFPSPDVHFAELVSAVAKQVGLPLFSFKSSFPNDNIQQTQDPKLRTEDKDSEKQKGKQKTCSNLNCTCKDIPEDEQFCPECGTKEILDLEEIERQKELQNKEKSKKFLLRIGSIVGLLAILIIAIVLISDYNQNRAYEIQWQKKELEEQKEKQADSETQRQKEELAKQNVKQANAELKVNTAKMDQKANQENTEQKTNQTRYFSRLIDMVVVEGQSFIMGRNEFDGDEPEHKVTLSTFQMGKTEITQEQWKEVMGYNPSIFKGSNMPVENVSWFEAVAFCNKLSEMEGLEAVYEINNNKVIIIFGARGYRLPTEAEWEYAARGGSQSNNYVYAGSNILGEVAEYVDNNNKTTKPVGGKKPNELGFFDISGNVREWCQDWYGKYTNTSQTNPMGPSSGYERVSRGGCWESYDSSCRLTYRDHDLPDERMEYLGFRVVFVP